MVRTSQYLDLKRISTFPTYNDDLCILKYLVVFMKSYKIFSHAAEYDYVSYCKRNFSKHYK